MSTAVAAHAQLKYTTNDGAITITGYSGNPTNVTIPSSINGLPVTSIANEAFEDYTNLAGVSIPSTVTNIGPTAFQSCSKLASIVIPNGVAGIGLETFLYCTNLTNVTLPATLTNIASQAFAECGRLQSIAVPTGVTSIQFESFNWCTSLVNITIPKTVTNLEENAFAYCTNLAGIFFAGNAPSYSPNPLLGVTNAIVYYIPGTTGWSNTYDGLKTMAWNPTPRASGVTVGPSGGAFQFEVVGTSNIPVVIEASTSVGNAQWLPLQSCTLTNGSIIISDTAWTNNSSRFYRVRSP